MTIYTLTSFSSLYKDEEKCEIRTTVSEHIRNSICQWIAYDWIITDAEEPEIIRMLRRW